MLPRGSGPLPRRLEPWTTDGGGAETTSGDPALVAWAGQNMTLPLPTQRAKLPRVTTDRFRRESRTGVGRGRIRLIAAPAEPFIYQSFTPTGWARRRGLAR